MNATPDTIRVVIPLTIRKRNGRPKILPPDDVDARNGRTQDPHVLRAIARAWSWRRQLEVGAASTIQDIAATEKVSDRFVGRMLRLAYLNPDVLEHLVIRRVPPALSLNDLVSVTDRPWAEQMRIVFDRRMLHTAQRERSATSISSAHRRTTALPRPLFPRCSEIA
ncbi:hypothetical protein [Devosia sp.]|jgi:hypothetical protein|uniref:hypothetical protein n=1 Tax=Devosia sp. TaxID=1871048 RepID=UPI0037BEBFFC